MKFSTILEHIANMYKGKRFSYKETTLSAYETLHGDSVILKHILNNASKLYEFLFNTRVKPTTYVDKTTRKTCYTFQASQEEFFLLALIIVDVIEEAVENSESDDLIVFNN